jgi:hypothetical protein
MLLNVGPSRADGLPGVEKISMHSGAIIRDIVKAVLYVSLKLLNRQIHGLGILCRGIRAFEDPIVVKMLKSGIEKPPLDDDDGRSPRATR